MNSKTKQYQFTYQDTQKARILSVLSNNDESTLRKLGLNVTCEPEFSSDDLFAL